MSLRLASHCVVHGPSSACLSFMLLSSFICRQCSLAALFTPFAHCISRLQCCFLAAFCPLLLVCFSFYLWLSRWPTSTAWWGSLECLSLMIFVPKVIMPFSFLAHYGVYLLISTPSHSCGSLLSMNCILHSASWLCCSCWSLVSPSVFHACSLMKIAICFILHTWVRSTALCSLSLYAPPLFALSFAHHITCVVERQIGLQSGIYKEKKNLCQLRFGDARQPGKMNLNDIFD